MATVQYPTNDTARLVALQTAQKTFQSDMESGRTHLMSDTANSITTFLPSYTTKVASIEESRGVRMGEIAEKNSALSALKMYIQHSWHSVKNRVDRLEEPVTVLLNYDLPASGLVPPLSSSPELTVIADRLIAGDTKAVAAGFAPLVNPTAEELSAINEVAKKELADVPAADRAVDEAEEALATLRAQADELIRDITADLNYTLRREEEASRRRIMRSYGVKFRVDTE